ncbi:MAG: hypothetical protein VW270_03835, partial [Candidatus Poseidoniales archaeon]
KIVGKNRIETYRTTTIVSASPMMMYNDIWEKPRTSFRSEESGAGSRMSMVSSNSDIVFNFTLRTDVGSAK